MSDFPLSNIPGRITASAEMLEAAVAELLRLIPEIWQAYNPDGLSETTTQALFLLTAAGMVERRERLRLRMANHSLVAEATITFTGEYGGLEALEPLVASLWADWQDAFRAWKDGETADVSPAHCERLEPSEWRLTDQGVIARKDLDATGPQGADMRPQPQGAVFDFVLKRGFFRGRQPVPGVGALVRMDKIKAEAAPAAVNIGNWREGGDAFAQSFGPIIVKMFEAMQAQAKAPAPALPAPAAAPAPARKGKAKAAMRSWTQDDLDNAIREYKAQRAASYADLREAVRKNKPGAKKKAKEVYGRNAIARALGVKSTAMVSKSPPWVAIAEDLGLTLNRGRRAQGTRHTHRPGRVGHEIAIEEKSERPEEGADNAPAEQQLESAERQETIRRINAMARHGKTAKKRADNQKAADDLIQRLQRDEVTDDQARKVVQMVLNPQE